MLTRRGFLLSAAAAGALACSQRPARASTTPRWVAAAREADGTFALYAIDAGLEAELLVRHGERLHGLALDTSGRIWAPDRRPGAALVMRDAEGTFQTVAATPGRHFYGHAIRAGTEERLFTTENNLADFNGILQPRDPGTGAAQGPGWSTGGIGPHELRALKGRIVVANGGLKTHPDSGRQVLNPGDMQSSVCWLDSATGKLSGRAELAEDLSSLSLRHMAAAEDRVFIGAQDQAPDGTERPMVFAGRADGGMAPLHRPDGGWLAWRSYVGSLAFDPSGTLVAASTPRGNRVGIWRVADGAWVAGHPERDVCGLAAGTAPGRFLLSSGMGDLVEVAVAPGRVDVLNRRRFDRAWDNHLENAL